MIVLDAHLLEALGALCTGLAALVWAIRRSP